MIQEKEDKEHLIVTTQGIRGKASKTSEEGLISISTCKGLSNIGTTTVIDVFEGKGKDYKRRTEAKITFLFPDGKEWKGTFNQLKAKLKPTKKVLWL